jgi:hypothetical protein
MQILCHGNVSLPSLSSPSDDPDWTKKADVALANADINDIDILLSPPEVIVIDNDDNVPLPPSVKQSLDYLPKLEPGGPTSLPPIATYPSTQRNPTCQRNLPSHLNDYHLFTMVAKDIQMSYPYVNAKGNTDDLAFDDEHWIAKVCHYVMLHCAKSIFVGNPNKKTIWNQCRTQEIC